ncbi:MAG: homoserine kinase [Armatimonadota bacterium]
MKSYQIKLPATSANMGAGFDCLSVALSKYLKLKASLSDSLNITVAGKYARGIVNSEHNLIFKVFKSVYNKLNPDKDIPSLTLVTDNDIPVEKGLGSSAAAITGGIILAYLFSGINPEKDKIFAEAVNIEGHADNVGACVYGGMRVNKKIRDDEYVSVPFGIPYKMSAHLVIPDFSINTKKARNILPSSYGREETVESLSSLAFVLASLKEGRWHNLKYCRDFIHEPYRLGLNETLHNLFDNLKQIDNSWVFLSGSGSTIVVMEKESEPLNAEKIKQIISSQDLSCEYEKIEIATEGAVWS